MENSTSVFQLIYYYLEISEKKSSVDSKDIITKRLKSISFLPWLINAKNERGYPEVKK